MKVLYIINNLGSGGAEKLIQEAVPLMNKRTRVKVDVLLLTDRNNVFDKGLVNSGVKVDIIPFRNPYSFKNILYIRNYIVKGNYDIIHAHLFPTIYWVSIASRLIFSHKPKFVMTEHSTHNRRREREYLRYLEKFIYSGYDKIISISKPTQNNLISWLKVKPNRLNKFIVIENGVNIDKFKNAIPYKKSEICSEFTQNTKLVCMVGRFSKAKDQLTLIKAMKNLPKNIHLLLVGEGHLKEKNGKLAKNIGVNKRVHFLGYRDDVERILKTIDIMVLSSNWEGFGLAAVEGMAAGKPVIASNIDGLREIVGQEGILFEKGNDLELANKIENLIKDTEEKTYRMRKSLFKANSHDISIMVGDYINLYKQQII
ncbi:glycosyltransferase [Sporanaerobacter sp. PP17-6a]|uniref:glycosyltransferase n=1 Tax=Sporanaerobacter sp. PP17-6a TaxID=1891289 RepID=UPI00089F961F|nr:glycosyltransferase [Sporanaerobacter sp. PP17-6a]SCL85403.1 putative glycosyltransferase EpsD [Sporanaerobacter sp. PP17-6a]